MLLQSPPTQFLNAFEQVRGQWFAAVLPIATNLFTGLALIEFSWSAAELMLERTNLESYMAGLVKKLMWIGAFYALLLFGPTWIPAIVNSFTQIGQQASGVGPLQPGAVFGRGLDLAGALLSGASSAGFLSNFSTALSMVIAAISTFICFVLISIQLVAALVESYIVVAAAFVFLGFGGSRWTAPYVEKYIALAVGVGVKIMILYLLIGVGMTLSANWVANAKLVATSPSPITNALDIMGESLIFIALCWFVPKIIAGVLGGSPAFTGGEIIGIGSTIAYGATMAGRTAMGYMSSGASTVASSPTGPGAAGTGGLTAGVMTAPGASNGASSQPPPPVAASVSSNGGSSGAGHDVPLPSKNGKGD